MCMVKTRTMICDNLFKNTSSSNYVDDSIPTSAYS